ncbi:LVIVD repeat-containing protein [Salegentibacter sp.]|uniref:LVIVD repeat-containing protein n=1 Tax=Salegentibacter sp. TaxID=1903072 RepID=UPI0035635A85
MRIFYSLIALLLMALMTLFTSCQKEEDAGNMELVAVPVTMSVADFRTSVYIQEAKEIEQAGKIYTYKDYVFINDVNRGVHIIDNSNPETPQKIKYLKIPQNTDVAIKEDMLFANSGMDLVVFDISDINNIKQQERVEDVFENYQPTAPVGAAFVDTENLDFQKEVIIGYVLERRKIEMVRDDRMIMAAESFNSDASGFAATGTGGSMARFNIKDKFLYVVGQQTLSVFNISSLSSPEHISTDYVGWQIETIFNQDDYLYLGSSTGMYIYSIEDPSTPEFVSVLQHVLGCDPVVVDGDMAYVTIRGGNECGQSWSQLQVIDVADKQNPELLATYEMDSPYGLGVKDDLLFVCDGDSGLKIYDKTQSPGLTLTDHFQDINTYDVIPLEEVLLMVGDDILHQYTYADNEIRLLSSFSLN